MHHDRLKDYASTRDGWKRSSLKAVTLRGDFLQARVSGAQNQSDCRSHGLHNNKMAACFFQKFEV